MTAIESPQPASIPFLRLAAVAALVVIGFFLPRLLGGTSVAYSTLTTIAIFAVMCYGADIVLSYLGEVSLGHTVFWAIGGYAAANLSVKYGLNGWATAAATIALCLAAAAFLGAVTLRTREFVFSLVTYAAAVVAYEIAFNWDAVGGSDGIVGIPPLKLPLLVTNFSGAMQEDLWPIAFALLLLTLAFIARFRRSRLGTTALMVQMNPALAASLGVDPRRIRLAVFVISAPITGLAGWLYAYQRAYVGPDMFESYFLVMMLTAIVLVGRRILLGPLIGTAVLIVQQNLLSLGGDWNKIVLGSVLALVLIFWPAGLVGLYRRITKKT
ncbi:branched-chain amino acid transport system permease protein [Bradyrhizobium japonicum]|jgi:branched-chain amino acid transport system permease protein|uniref:branched-chain amino acid ABC transporter permease n=1 Tax=Bradyrhizobium TaxID=374 RepID=UPI0004128510|nr:MULTISPECIES: branched-chain amino acid ABC transporter permease [Bradyrhizobium]MBR0876320.1 branched-chain amino acid ABC transporter permease [Bradyrhizobium liaoningense]MBR0941402.1 branched-chain amino acid ABC transporter permease [Bradyrhizobium liaoningense]MBR0995821.1 branched-chain amino acid ABC transporter permease [Bradyrhizobium liaoningense]MBR1025784.1 branched-chain amino acid ABC transporter permease [Bradyrhizobium liaoningense]MBR1062868.1 branched-chain amino acid ABC